MKILELKPQDFPLAIRLTWLAPVRFDLSEGKTEEWRAQGDDLRTFLSEFTSSLPQIQPLVR